MRLNRKFFNRSTVAVAKELLGKYLCRRINGKIMKARIIETEAYCGKRDLACHSSKGLTPRTKIMFGPPGYAYIYLIYGMYHCFNIVTREQGCPEAVLIRGCELANGPGKLCRELKIDKKLNGVDLAKSKEIWVEDYGEPPGKIMKGKRIGVEYAGKWKNKMWRFWVD